ncbi:hypothetical protein AGRA3207_002343 [Actinomadura graeca]|uniref:Uncharacterized protein n=1 Tax=Actinomadura graeca TaxID=2750812 RepID=A0ABX8R833_9ACTN|nr:hypothetical protein AGRA3207_002343 [Actinomadura graeca]
MDPRARPYVAAAVHAYGTAVLAPEQDAGHGDAGPAARVGRRLLRQVFGVRDEADAPRALADLAESPDDEDLQAVLRVRIRKALAADGELAGRIRAILDEAPAAGAVSVTASGERSIAAHTISGVASTGDGAEITR